VGVRAESEFLERLDKTHSGYIPKKKKAIGGDKSEINEEEGII
jgi:hypothetical protein